VGSEEIRDLNDQVRGLADSLPNSAETKFGFRCQCGCGTVVPLTSRNFDANGAWADGHNPDDARVPVDAEHQRTARNFSPSQR
jgi:hypothetical protein